MDFRQDITSWLTVDAGVRLDHHSVLVLNGCHRQDCGIRPMTTGEIKAMVSKGFRNPTMREMYLYPPSNEELDPERLWNYELSWKHRMDDGYTYGANLFYIKGDNMIQTVTTKGTPKNVNTGEIENYGFELEASCPINTYVNIRANTSYLHMKNKIVAAPEATVYARY